MARLPASGAFSVAQMSSVAVMGTLAPFPYGACPQPALEPFLRVGHRDALSLAKEARGGGVHAEKPPSGSPGGDQRAQRHCPHPHPQEEGQALLFGILSRSCAEKYQVLGVSKGTFMFFYESCHPSTCSIDQKDSTKAQQVTFGPRIGRGNLVPPGAPLNAQLPPRFL